MRTERSGDDRRKDERRKKTAFWPVEERRKGAIRKGDRRKARAGKR